MERILFDLVHVLKISYERQIYPTGRHAETPECSTIDFQLEFIFPFIFVHMIEPSANVAGILDSQHSGVSASLPTGQNNCNCYLFLIFVQALCSSLTQDPPSPLHRFIHWIIQPLIHASWSYSCINFLSFFEFIFIISSKFYEFVFTDIYIFSSVSLRFRRWTTVIRGKKVIYKIIKYNTGKTFCKNWKSTLEYLNLSMI